MSKLIYSWALHSGPSPNRNSFATRILLGGIKWFAQDDNRCSPTAERDSPLSFRIGARNGEAVSQVPITVHPFAGQG